MAETAAHLADHVFPRLAVRQWVLSVPKRLRYFLQRDGAALNTALRIFLSVIQGSLHQHCPAHIPGARAPLWDDCDAQAGEGVDVEPDWDVSVQIAPDYRVDQRINW